MNWVSLRLVEPTPMPPQILRFLQFFVCLFFFASLSFGQSLTSSEQYHQLLQLRETKRVLYVAAHPDDENTRMIAYLANGEHAEVAYLSLTRGDGGQNLIGKELGIELGQIRYASTGFWLQQGPNGNPSKLGQAKGFGGCGLGDS